MIEMDKYFNLEEVSNEEDIDFAKFEDDLLQIAEDERLASIAPDLPT